MYFVTIMNEMGEGPFKNTATALSRFQPAIHVLRFIYSGSHSHSLFSFPLLTLTCLHERGEGMTRLFYFIRGLKLSVCKELTSMELCMDPNDKTISLLQPHLSPWEL